MRTLTYHDFYRTGIQDCGNSMSPDDFEYEGDEDASQIVERTWAQWEADGMEDQWLAQQDDLQGLDPHEAYDSWRTGWKECAVGSIGEWRERELQEPQANPAEISPAQLYGKLVRVHYNLHRCPRGRDPLPDEACWVVSTKQHGAWKVAGYVPSLLISDVKFQVSTAGVERIRQQGSRAVVAWIVGTVADPATASSSGWMGVGFNPFKADHFYVYETGEPILTAPAVYVGGRKAMAATTASANPSDRGLAEILAAIPSDVSYERELAGLENNPSRNDYVYETDCIGSDYDSIRLLIESEKPITMRQFAMAIGPDQWKELQRNLGYDRDFKISGDWHVDYREGVYRGVPAVFLRHSGIEHIFTKRGVDVPAFPPERYGAENNPPKHWWRRPVPPPRACYRTKAEALKAFLDTNYEIVENYGGADYQVGPAEFDAINRKYDLKGKRAARTIADAVWYAMPVGKPFCLDRIDLEALNDTSPAREAGVAFRLPDINYELLMRAEEEAIAAAQVEEEELPAWVTEHEEPPPRVFPPVPSMSNLVFIRASTAEQFKRMKERSERMRKSNPVGSKYTLGTWGPRSRVQLGDPSGTVMRGEWVRVVENRSTADWVGTVVVKNERTGAVSELDAMHPVVDISYGVERNPNRGNPVQRWRVWFSEAPDSYVTVEANGYMDAMRLAAPMFKGAHDGETREMIAKIDGGHAIESLVSIGHEGRLTFHPEPSPWQRALRDARASRGNPHSNPKFRAQRQARAAGSSRERELARMRQARQRMMDDPGEESLEAYEAARLAFEAQENPRSEADPAWVTKTIAKHYVELEDEVPAKWLPKIVKATVKKGKLVGTMKEYGCGAYGCVLPTLDPDVVLKLTTDDTEAEFATNLAGKLAKKIVVDYHMTKELPEQYRGRDSYLLWRDAADMVGDVVVAVMERGGDAAEAEQAIYDQHQAANKAFHALHQGEPAKELLEEWVEAAKNMGRVVPELRSLANGMVANLREKKIFFGDVHAGNIGLVKGRWLIVDPGHVAVLRAR